MSKLLDAIRADAEKHLSLPAGRRPAEEVERYQRFLKRQDMRIRIAHNKGEGGRETCAARSLAVDLVFCSALSAAAALPEYEGCAKTTPWAVVALGGYGRTELSPHSDIDVQFLHDRSDVKKKPCPPFLELLEGSWLFNVFPKVQALVRTPGQCVEAGNKDLRSKTSLIEARLVCGDPRLFETMRKRVLAGCVKGHEDAYIEQRLRDQAARRERYGNTPFVQEPNLKNGCGGLRDYQNLLWMAFFRYGARTTADLEQRGLIKEREHCALDDAYEFLLRVRNDLHYRGDRTNDVLTKHVQPAVARAMGYHNGSPRERLERLMQVYYQHVREIHDLTRNLEQRLALVRQPGRLPRLAYLLRERRKRAAYELDGFKFVDGEVLAASERIFEAQPRRLMRVFLNAQQRGLKLDPDLARLVRDHVHLVDRAFREDPVVHEAFLLILQHPGKVAPILRQMNELGVLGAFLPAWNRLAGLVQHEFYHQFTADEHTLVCLEKLDAIWNLQNEKLTPYTEIFKKIQRPQVLYLALLLHDTGKGEGRNHAESGARIAATVARRLRLPEADADRLQFLVRHHLSMVSISQKRDLDDPHVIASFAERVANAENLHALTLLTLADSLGTSDKLWSAFKDQLLLMLHERVDRHLRGEIRLAEEADRARLRAEVRSLVPREIHDDEIDAHFANLPPSYFREAHAGDVATDVQLAHEFMRAQVLGEDSPMAPVVQSSHTPAHGCSVVRCCAWDRHGLFGRLAGALTAAGLNILSAEIYTRGDGFVLDTFYVVEPATGNPAGQRALERFKEFAREALTGQLDLVRRLRSQRGLSQPRYLEPGGEPLAPRIQFHQESSPTRTILEVDAEDRLGLLYTIATVLAGLGVDIALAKINTANGVASDAFYISEAGGQPIQPGSRQGQIISALLKAIRQLD